MRSELTMMCQGCGWTVTLPFVGGDRVSIEAVDGWSIEPDDHRVLCERCAKGWRPRPLVASDP